MLDVLRRITQEVNAARDLNIALDIIVDRVQSAMGTEVCSVYLLDDERKQYVFMATRGLNTEMVGKVTLELDEGLVGLVGGRAEPFDLHNASRQPRYHYEGELGEEKYESFLGVPVIHHRKVLGVIVVQQTGRRRFDESEEAFLITLSAQLAGIIVHAQATGAFTISGVAADLPASRFPGTAGAPPTVGCCWLRERAHVPRSMSSGLVQEGWMRDPGRMSLRVGGLCFRCSEHTMLTHRASRSIR